MGATTVASLVAEHAKKAAEIADLESALAALRAGKSWELGIENDARPSIGLLYRTLANRRAELQRFCDVVITGTMQP